jgi:hypothetical protein
VAGRCSSCHRSGDLRRISISIALRNRRSKCCEVRVCGGCAAALLDTLGAFADVKETSLTSARSPATYWYR